MSGKDYLKILTQRLTSLEKNKSGQSSILPSMIENQSCIDTHKDLVAYNNIVLSLCEPNKVIMTNEHKQLTTCKLGQLISGTQNQINVSQEENNHIILSCPQDIGTQSYPQFNKIKLTGEPTELTDVTTKKYVDDTIIAHDGLNMTSRIDVINPTGDCLRIGRTTGNYININVDMDGTLNLTNEKPNGTVNEIDIYGQRINLLSNLNSTDPKSGSIVSFGGVGILKDLHIGGGLFLRTEEGIPTKLDFFEEGIFPIEWTGIWNDLIDASLAYQRIGNWVMLMIPYTAGRTSEISNNGSITNTTNTYLPSRLRPIYDIGVNIDGLNNDVKTSVKAIIYGDSGQIVIKPINDNYNGSGFGGFDTFSISYMVDTKK